MGYEVTATRRRPQEFDALAGQEFVAETLKNSILSKKIAHAYLFSGPRGCGKTSTARILAKALNCAEGPTAFPCGKCQHCLEITKGASTDVIEIDGASNTSVNDVRQIKDEVLFPPQSSRYKIYIIDEVHMLSTSAFNALLKTIEEPPPYVIFIFATTELQKVPATIKSRCQQFNFRLVPVERVKQLLADAASEIGIQADDEALYWIARESTGSVRDAYTLFDQVAAFSGDSITYDKIRDKLGLVGVERLNAIFEDAALNRTQDVLLKIDEFLQNGISIEQFIANCTDYLRSVLLIKSGVTKESVLGQSAERFSGTVVETWSAVQIERALSLLLQLYRDIRYSLSPRYELELAFSRLSWLSQYVSPAEVKKAIDAAGALLSSAPKTEPAAAQGGPNPYLNRAVPQMNVRPSEQSQRPVPTNIFALEPTPAGNSATQNVQDDSGLFVPPPDPTPENLSDYQSFSFGGAVPPEQTAGVHDGGGSSGDFRERAIKMLMMKDPMLASSLSQTGAWKKTAGTITTSIQSSFQKMQIDSHTAEISQFLTEFFGEPVVFSVELKQIVDENREKSVPENIQLLCSIFKGEIVGRSKKSEQEIAEYAAQKKNSQPEEKTATESDVESDDDSVS